AVGVAAIVAVEVAVVALLEGTRDDAVSARDARARASVPFQQVDAVVAFLAGVEDAVAAGRRAGQRRARRRAGRRGRHDRRARRGGAGRKGAGGRREDGFDDDVVATIVLHREWLASLIADVSHDAADLRGVELHPGRTVEERLVERSRWQRPQR